ncbi:hypothetical protein BST81_20250 [Leptolyngbya sp. 'hensonii']|uniref:hypothetical protein n=1 Tax=Leptolyngbya sp. 'hensonii' TaxID=1922337 RepID=UPI00094F9420|nr:hypothetical protein [Leptolyngbya sp. 'hensonii']OLP16535.1 hypothetical protein BST81_20250 [Leptolyngbya sp. 'hensonii']
MSETDQPLPETPTSSSGPIPLSPPPRKPKPEKVTLGEAIARGWDWITFSWQTLQRLGGPGEIFKSLSTITGMMVKRTLIQWGVLKQK